MWFRFDTRFNALICASILFCLACGQTQTGLSEVSHPGLDGLEGEAQALVSASQKTLEVALSEGKSTQIRAKAFADLGILYFAFGFYEPAKTCFGNAQHLESGNYRWPYYLGRLPHDDNAINQVALERVLELEPNHTSSKIALGQIYKKRNRLADSEQLFKEAVATNPNHPVAHFELGLLELARKQPQKAIDHFDQTLKSDPRASAVHYQKALALRQLGQIEGAETQMALRGDRQPTLVDPLMAAVLEPSALAHYRLAESLRLSGKNPDAIEHYDQTVELLSDQVGPRVGRVLNLIQIGQDAEAMIRLRDDIKIFPNNAVLLHLLARLLSASSDAQVRDGEKALQLMHILGKGTVTAEMVETLAMAFAEVGDFPQAISFQERAISVTDDSDPHFFQRLQSNLSGYHQRKPCRQPWPPNAHIFRLNTYAAMHLIPSQPNQAPSK